MAAGSNPPADHDTVPRSKDDDYTLAMADRRREFIRSHTGAEMASPSLSPARTNLN